MTKYLDPHGPSDEVSEVVPFDLPALAGTALEGGPRTFGTLRLRLLDDVLTAPPRTYLLKGLFAPAELSVVWGAPKCGKSFLVMRLVFGLAMGRGMWGRRAKKARVLYVAAEGEGGIGGRLHVLREQLGHPGDGFQLITQRAVVGRPSVDVKHIVAAAKAMRADMVVIDTLARTFGDGDENLAADMGAFVVGVDAIREETGAHCLIVHHGARTGTNSRGSSALDGAADTIIKVERGEQGAPHVATVAASKDDADGTAMHFTLRVVELGEDEDGDPRTTCVAVEAEPRTKKGKLRPKAAEALDALHELVASAGLPLPAGPVATEHPHLRCVPLEVWRSKLAGRAITDAWAGATERSAWKRVFDELNGARLIGVAGNPRSPGAGSVVWPTQMKGLA